MKPAIKRYPPPIQAPYFFGCNKRGGHYAWDRRLFMKSDVPAEVEQWLSEHDGKLPPQDQGQTQGEAQLRVWPDDTPAGGLTVLAFWDRSVDTRRNSSASFMLPGVLSFDEAVEAAREAFPSVWERFTYDIMRATQGLAQGE